jgi:hypothetical protein
MGTTDPIAVLSLRARLKTELCALRSEQFIQIPSHADFVQSAREQRTKIQQRRFKMQKSSSKGSSPNYSLPALKPFVMKVGEIIRKSIKKGSIP